MQAAKIFLPSLMICFGTFCWSQSARADFFSSWVAATCDASAGRAAIKFGYADADDSPLFIQQAEPSLDDGISAIPVTNASRQETACILKDGRELKARVDSGNAGNGQYSVWIGRRKVIHGEIYEDHLPYELLFYPGEFRTCTFALRPGGPYDVTSAGQQTTAIKCDPTRRPLEGKVDLIEYPVNHARAPLLNTILLSSGNPKFCQQLIRRSTEQDGTVSDLIEDSDEMESPASAGHQETSFLTFDGRKNGHIDSLLFDIWNTGHPVRVYRFDSGGTFTDEFLVVPKADTSADEVIGLPEVDGDFTATAVAARAKGWTVYAAAGTPLENRSINISLLRIHNVSYLLYQKSGESPNPMAVLSKLELHRTGRNVCVFDYVYPHF